MNSEEYAIIDNEMVLVKDIYFIEDGVLKVLHTDGETEDAPEGHEVSNFIREEANKFLNIEPDWRNVNSAFFIGDPKGFLMKDGTYLDAFDLNRDAANMAEIEICLAIQKTAEYVYKTKKRL